MLPKSVFAHYMVGLTLNQTIDHWQRDIASAAAVSIDGFALNIGANDSFTYDSLRRAYDAAAAEVPAFRLFLSFDFGATGEWDVARVAELITTFKNEKAQSRVDGRPMVSTFEGVDFAESWGEVRSKVEGGIYFVPDWSSLGVDGLGEYLEVTDGHSYTSPLAPRNKTYMSPLPPYFYTNLPSLNKNWHVPAETLWYDRLEQMIESQPDMVQIIS
ncbi:hypothetical protein OQA88_10922 [Cercophora sp. LCS_1]